MTTFGEEAVELLEADLTLRGILIGGVYNYPETGKSGLTRLLSPTAWDDQNGLIKPVAVVLELDETADDQIVGANMSAVTPLVVWIYEKAYTDTGFTTIDAAYSRIYTLLHLAQIGGACQILWKSCIKNRREALLKDCGYFRATFNVYGYR